MRDRGLSALEVARRQTDMSSSFFRDEHPGSPRILFVGLGESSHTHSWIDLLEGARFNVRLFSLPSGVPPDEWRVKTCVTVYGQPPADSETRIGFFNKGRTRRLVERSAARLTGAAWNAEEKILGWLADIIRHWRPHVVHTLGIDPAGELLFNTRSRYGLKGIGKWVLQTRGGSDLALSQHDPERQARLGQVLRDCDQLVCDNLENFRIARSLGVQDSQLSDITPVPGTGGIDVNELAGRWQGPPSQRRTIVWPKAYEVTWSKALPVFEALKSCWQRLPSCRIELFATNAEARAWYWTLPPAIRDRCLMHERVPRSQVLESMTKARVMLAPSLVDGTPNSMFEAMAAGALPIVSPLQTIASLVAAERNVLFARNLYPDEIAEALVRAMTDDALVDTAAEENLTLVRRVADRASIRARVVAFYERLAARHA
jgi:glycosyltransferase involved in cell wall biosynthesis